MFEPRATKRPQDVFSVENGEELFIVYQVGESGSKYYDWKIKKPYSYNLELQKRTQDVLSVLVLKVYLEGKVELKIFRPKEINWEDAFECACKTIVY